MKHQFKQIAHACLLVTMASAAVCAHADLTVGGVFDVGYKSTKTPSATSKEVNGSFSDLSRIVISGDVALKDGMKGIFTVESDFFNPGSGSSNTGSFANGEVQAGLTGGFGMVQAGRVNSATFFNTLFYQPYGTAVGSQFGNYTNGIVRFDNTAKYTSPSIKGIKGSLLYAPKNTDTSGVSELGLSYNSGPLSIGFASLKGEVLAANASSNYLNATKDYVVNSLGLSYNAGSGLKLMLLTDKQTADSGAVADRSNTALSAVYVMGQNQFSGTLGSFKDNKKDAGATSSTAAYTTLGYDYLLDSKAASAIYARFTGTDNKTLRAGSALGIYNTMAVGYRFAF
jgi:predicted porin